MQFAPLNVTVQATRGVEHWFKIDLTAVAADPQRQWELEIAFPNLDYADIFVVYADAQYQRYVVGDEARFNDWPIAYRQPSVPLSRDGNFARVVYMSMADTGQPLILPLQVISAAAQREKQQREYAWYGFVAGGIGILALYNLIIYVFVRRSSYLWYALYLLPFGLLIVSMAGLGQQFLWPGLSHATTRIALAAMALTNAGLIMFASRFMELPELHPKLSRALTRFAVLLLLPLLLLPFVDYIYVQWLLHGMALVSIVLMLVVVIYMAFQANRPARYLLASYTILFSGVIFALLRFNGVISGGFLSEHLLELAVILEGLILSIGLADRINELNQQKHQLEFKRRRAQETFTRQLIQVQETEKRTFGAILHDSIGQQLVVLQKRLEKATELIRSSEDDKAVRLLDDIQNYSSDLLSDIRRLSRDSHPYLLEQVGFVRAMEALMQQSFEGMKIEYSCHIEAIESPASQQHLYRITQECIHNTLKHADATECLLVVQRVAEKVDAGGAYQYLYKDDGCGFDMRRNNGHEGVGLTSIYERVSILNGHCKITSAPGAGVSVIIII